MVCKEAMFASGSLFTFCSLWVHCVLRVVQHGLERQYTLVVVFWVEEWIAVWRANDLRLLKDDEHARPRMQFYVRNPCSAVKMLRKWHSLSRLETRTKESDVYASIWVSNPYAQWKWQMGLFSFSKGRRTIGRPWSAGERFECEHRRRDPKDGELCMTRAKPGETLVEARSAFNVQINRQSCV